MNLLIDESVDRQTVARLRQEEHDVLYVAEMEPGIADDVVLNRANERGALLITAYKDFGELVYRQGHVNAGVLLIRLFGLSNEKKGEIVATAIREHADELPQAFSVASPNSIRIRKQQP
jgi:predicted nuclease of predicted toxin-antitoxin system